MTTLLDRLRDWIHGVFPAATGSPRQTAGARPPRFQTSVEQLEDRAVPACLSPDPFICNPLPASHDGLAMHTHVRLGIVINGREQTIPVNIGISPRGYNPIHTHTADGQLHLESPVERDFTMKDFFDIWGFVFSDQEILGYYTDANQPLQVFVNDQPVPDHAGLILRDHDVIQIHAVNAFPLANLGNVALGFTHSDENFKYFITQAYQRYLGRGPDPQGLDGWVARMRAGLTDEQLEANFIGSAEYIANHGGTGAAWVRGLYQDLLGRQPDQTGLQNWLARLANDNKPYDIAYGFAASAEREGMRVRDIYTTFLGRGASQQEVDGWVTQFINGARQEAVVAGFVASREYFNSSTKGQGDRAEWVRSAYRDVLRRAAGEPEVASWVQVLSRG